MKIQTYIPTSLQTIIRTIIVMCVVTLAGCGGGSTSTDVGVDSFAVFTASKTFVRGNVSSVGDGIGVNIYDTDSSFNVKMIANFITDSIISSANAGDRIVEDIEVCVEGRCTFTDENGRFELDLTGLAAGTYIMTFSFDGKTYSFEVEIVDNAIVIMEGVSISDDGVVRVNNIKVVLNDTEEESDDEDESDESDDENESDDEDESDDEEKVVLCHKPGTPAEKTIEVAAPAVPAHEAHGDTLGAC